MKPSKDEINLVYKVAKSMEQRLINRYLDYYKIDRNFEYKPDDKIPWYNLELESFPSVYADPWDTAMDKFLTWIAEPKLISLRTIQCCEIIGGVYAKTTTLDKLV
jgi:hypothetical protein